MNYAVIYKQDEHGENSRGYIKALTASQNYENALEDFEEHVKRCWKYELDHAPELTWWQKNVSGWSIEDAVRLQGDRQDSLWQLHMKVTHKRYKSNVDTWKVLERRAFDGKVDVARYYRRYHQLRHIIRNGCEWHVDADTCAFIDKFYNHPTAFR